MTELQSYCYRFDKTELSLNYIHLVRDRGQGIPPVLELLSSTLVREIHQQSGGCWHEMSRVTDFTTTTTQQLPT